MSDSRKKYTPPKAEQVEQFLGKWVLTFNHDKKVQADLEEFFMHGGGRINGQVRVLSKFYRLLKKQDRPGGKEDFFLAIGQPAFDAHDDLHKTLQEGRYPEIDDYLSAYGMAIAAKTELAVWTRVKALFAESRGLPDAAFIEVIDKARRDLRSMETGRRKSKTDALGKILTKIVEQYLTHTGKHPSWDTVVDEMEDIIEVERERGTKKVVLQEVDREAGEISWLHANGEQARPVSFKALQNRLTTIRKKIKL